MNGPPPSQYSWNAAPNGQPGFYGGAGAARPPMPPQVPGINQTGTSRPPMSSSTMTPNNPGVLLPRGPPPGVGSGMMGMARPPQVQGYNHGQPPPPGMRPPLCGPPTSMNSPSQPYPPSHERSGSQTGGATSGPPGMIDLL